MHLSQPQPAVMPAPATVAITRVVIKREGVKFYVDQAALDRARACGQSVPIFRAPEDDEPVEYVPGAYFQIEAAAA